MTETNHINMFQHPPKRVFKAFFEIFFFDKGRLFYFCKYYSSVILKI